MRNFKTCASCLYSERAYGIEAFGDLPSRNNWFTRYFWNRDELTYLTMLDNELALTSLSYSEARATGARQTAALKSGRMSQLVFPALQATRGAMHRTRALVRCLRVLNALQGHAELTSDPEPQLSEPDLPPEVTVDPFTDKPLILKK